MLCGKCSNMIEWASDMGLWYAFQISWSEKSVSPVECYDGFGHCRPFK